MRLRIHPLKFVEVGTHQLWVVDDHSVRVVFHLGAGVKLGGFTEVVVVALFVVGWIASTKSYFASR